MQYARRLSDVKATVARVRVFLGLGVLGGAVLALLAGLATARRAMAPIARADRDGALDRAHARPVADLPKPEADDEVAELADTLEEMLRSLDAARGETESALSRQREFVADASHELRTPLTAVLANLELLEEELAGEQRDTATAALRSTRRMRRLVADLLLLARADAGREVPHGPVDLVRGRSSRPRRSSSRSRATTGIVVTRGRRGDRRRRARRAAPPGAQPDGQRAQAHARPGPRSAPTVDGVRGRRSS